MPRLFAIAPRGVEPVTARELEDLGADRVKEDQGGVHFEGDLALLYRAHLHLRTAMRVLVFLREFAASTPAMLYDQVRRIHWDRHLTLDRTFAVHCVSTGRRKPEGMTHSHFVELKIKDAVADEMRKRRGARPDVDVKNPDVRIHAFLSGGRCRLSLDASGESLHRRGYRSATREAPLKETLAAALLDLAGWDPSVPLVDPMCGSGTIPIEAALKARRLPPGLGRERFGFMNWPDFDADLWEEVQSKARAGILENPDAVITASDSDPRAVAAARRNARVSGMDGLIRFATRPIEELRPADDRPGVVLMNPPYGHRLQDDQDLQGLYKRIGDTLKQNMKGWKAFIFTGNLQLAKYIGLRTSRRIPLFNGPIECRLLEYQLF